MNIGRGTGQIVLDENTILNTPVTDSNDPDGDFTDTGSLPPKDVIIHLKTGGIRG